MFTPRTGQFGVLPSDGWLRYPRAKPSFSPLSIPYSTFKAIGSPQTRPVALRQLPAFDVLAYQVLDAISVLTQLLAPQVRVMGVYSVAADVVHAMSGIVTPRSNATPIHEPGPPEVPPGQAKKEPSYSNHSQRSEQIEYAVQCFVDSYNKFLGYVESKGGKANQDVLRSIRATVLSAREQLAAAGIVVSEDGTLALSEERPALGEAQSEALLRGALLGESGVAARVEQALRDVLLEEVNGPSVGKGEALHDYGAASGLSASQSRLKGLSRGRLVDVKA